MHFFSPKVWEGLNVIKTGRVMLGETNPMDSKPGTIRGDLCVQVGRYIFKVLISSEDSKGQWCVVACVRAVLQAALHGQCGSFQRWRKSCSPHRGRNTEQGWHSLPSACLLLPYPYVPLLCAMRPLKNGVFFALRLEIL